MTRELQSIRFGPGGVAKTKMLLVAIYVAFLPLLSLASLDIKFITPSLRQRSSARSSKSAAYFSYTNASFYHGESPFWDDESSIFYWVDALNQDVHSINFDTSTHRVRHIDIGEVNVVIPVKDSKRVLLAVRSSLYLMDWDIPGDKGLRIIATLDEGLPDNVLNEGRADALGRLWIGSKGPQKGNEVAQDYGSLYTVEAPAFQPRVQLRPVTISNGMAWSLNNTLLYYVDSGLRRVDVFDYDLAKAHLSNRRTILDLNDYEIDDNIIPDGMTIDTDGFLWVALMFGGAILRVDPDRRLVVRTMKLPVTLTTSVAWGGPNMQSLFVTTSQRNLKKYELRRQQLAGTLFVFHDMPHRGVPSYQFVFPNADEY